MASLLLATTAERIGGPNAEQEPRDPSIQRCTTNAVLIISALVTDPNAEAREPSQEVLSRRQDIMRFEDFFIVLALTRLVMGADLLPSLGEKVRGIAVNALCVILQSGDDAQIAFSNVWVELPAPQSRGRDV